MDALLTARPRMQTHEEARRDERLEWGRMTAGERLAAVRELNKRMAKFRGVLAHESDRDVSVSCFVRRKG